MYEESNMETYILHILHILHMQNRQPMGICSMTQETQTGVCINLEGWDGEGDGSDIGEGGDICIPMADSC